MKFLLFILIFALVNNAPAAEQKGRRPHGSVARSLFGDEAVEEAISKALGPRPELPGGYWTEPRLEAVLHALVQLGVPLSDTYIKAVAEREGLDQVVQTVLDQPKSSTIKWLSTVIRKYGSLARFVRQKGYWVDPSALPDSPLLNEANLFSAVSIAERALGKKPIAKHILAFYPEGDVAMELERIFGMPVNGPFLWRLARQLGVRWGDAIVGAKTTCGGVLLKGEALQSLDLLVEGKGQMANWLKLHCDAVPSEKREIFHDLLTHIANSETVPSVGELRVVLMTSRLLDPKRAASHVSDFMEWMKQRRAFAAAENPVD